MKNNGTFITDKKRNAAYWDEIDNRIYELLNDVSKFSTSEVDNTMIDDGVADVRESVINFLIEIGGSFPYVDENM